MNNEWKAEKLVVLGLPSQVTYDLRLFDVPDTVHQRLLAVREDHDRSGAYRPILSRFLGTDSRLVASRRFVVE